MVNVSAFSASNAEHRRIWEEEAQPIIRNRSVRFERRIFDALAKCYSISKPAADEMGTAFGAYHREPRNPPWMFGMYCGDSEPSLTFELTAEDSDMAAIKLQTIEFGERHRQNNVHVLRSFGALLETGASIALAEDETCELCWLATLNQMHDTDAILELTKEAGLENFSVTALGTQLLIYTMGNIGGGPPQFEEAYDGALVNLRNHLHEEGLLIEGRQRIWHAWLSNYGTECFATHTYAAGRQLLGQRL
jgi:hypothetical protein